MDAEAYLLRHGWAGSGHSLHPHKATSLKKPLLVSKKVDVLGLGLRRVDAIADQWWLRAFDSSLKAMGSGDKGVLGQVREHGVRRGGLYGRFVRGERLEGSLLTPTTTTTTTGGKGVAEGKGKRKRSTGEKEEGRRKRKRTIEEEEEEGSTEERTARLAGRILGHSRAVRFGTATPPADGERHEEEEGLPFVEVKGASGEFSAREQKEARRLARGMIRARREEKKKKRKEGKQV